MMSMGGLLVLFPGALGDFLCFLPALGGLLQRHGGPLTLVCKPELHALLNIPDAILVSIDRHEIADLYADGGEVDASTRALLGDREHAYSWTGSGVPSFAPRLGAITAGSTRVFPFRAMRAGEHASDYYARCAEVGALPCESMLRIDTDWFVDLERSHDLRGRAVLILHPGSGSETKNWTGFGALAQRWRQRFGDRSAVVVLLGPAELEAANRFDDGQALTLRDLSLPQVAGLLNAGCFYVGNDSGISHLAGAVGARGVVLFGSTDPKAWAPRGGRLHLLRAPDICAECGPSIFCTHRLGVEAVERALLDGEADLDRPA